jgi:hypothetical protein
MFVAKGAAAYLKHGNEAGFARSALVPLGHDALPSLGCPGSNGLEECLERCLTSQLLQLKRPAQFKACCDFA